MYFIHEHVNFVHECVYLNALLYRLKKKIERKVYDLGIKPVLLGRAHTVSAVDPSRPWLILSLFVINEDQT